MPGKIIQKYVQGRIFDDEEVIVVRRKPKKYNDYIQGARDMFLRFMSIEDHNRETIKHLPRSQMEVFIKAALKEDGFLHRFMIGDKVTFRMVRNAEGGVTDITPVLHKRKELSQDAIDVINTCIYLREDGIEKNLRLNRAYIVNELREYFGEYNLHKLSIEIMKYIEKSYGDQ